MMRRKKRGSAKFSKIIFLLLPILLFLAFFLIFRSGLFSIKQIQIQGDKISCATGDQIKNESGLLGQNFFLLNNKRLQLALKTKFVCIKNAVVSRFVPDKVKLEIEARKPAAVLLSLKEKQASTSSLIENTATPEAEAVKDYFLVDSEGVVFSKSTDDSNIPKIYIYDQGIVMGKQLENSLINNSIKILDRIRTFNVIVKKSWIAEGFFIVNPDTSDPKIIFRLNDQIDIQLASLQLILAEAKIDLREFTFIDLRFNKPVVRFAPKKNG